MQEVQSPGVPGKGEVLAERVSPWSIPGAFEKLTEKQRDVVGWVYIGEDLRQHPKTLALLAKAGWILEVEGVIPGNPRGSAIDRLPLTVKRYVCPSMADHMAWCLWCDENCPDEHEAAAVKP